jgi:hypothetical protein
VLTNQKQTVEQALRLMIRLRQQRDVDLAFGKYHWRGSLPEAAKGRGLDSEQQAQEN